MVRDKPAATDVQTIAGRVKNNIFLIFILIKKL
jgi:hypothetical protein